MASLEEASRHLNQLIKLRMKAANIPGLAAAVTNREATLLISTQGFADMAARTPVTAETRFEIGSIGKSFTNIALLQLHDACRLDLHAPVTRYLPWFQVQSDYEPITIYHLMTHTAGIITGTELAPQTDGMKPGPCVRPKPLAPRGYVFTTRTSDTRLWGSSWKICWVRATRTLFSRVFSTR